MLQQVNWNMYLRYRQFGSKIFWIWAHSKQPRICLEWRSPALKKKLTLVKGGQMRELFLFARKRIK